MTDFKDIQERARKRFKQLEAKRRDPRFVKTIGKLVHLKLLTAPGVVPYHGRVLLEDALWAGEVEPRVYEVLPAVVLKRPRAFVTTGPLPDDLKEVLNELRHQAPKTPFRGIPVESYRRWLASVGWKDKKPSLLKTFRFNDEDVKRIARLKKKTGKLEIEILRDALAVLEARIG